MQRISVRLAVAVLSAAFTWYIYLLIARYFEAVDPVFMASVLLGSIVLHEVGHMIAFGRHGVSTFMFFAVILGGVGPLDPKQEQRLHDSAKAEIALAGMAGNIVAMLVGLGLWQLGVLTFEESVKVINLNAVLMVFNLLPFGMLDGGRMAKILFDSVKEDRDMVYVKAMTGVVLVAGAATFFLGQDQMIPAMLFILGFRRQAKNDDPLGSLKPTALTERQQCLWARTFVFLGAGSMVVAAFTPSWVG